MMNCKLKKGWDVKKLSEIDKDLLRKFSLIGFYGKRKIKNAYDSATKTIRNRLPGEGRRIHWSEGGIHK